MKKSIILALILFFIIGCVISIILTFDKNRRINIYLENQLKDSYTQFDVTYKNYNNLSQSLYNSILTNEEVLETLTVASHTTSLSEQDKARKKLYNLLLPDYQNWNTLGIKQLHFHLKNNVSFLRMHQPNKFGDDLTKIRYSVQYVNATQIPADGLEMGKFDNGFRFVYPIFDDHAHHTGSVEVSISVNDFLKKLDDSFHAKVNLMIDKSSVIEDDFHDVLDSKYTQTAISPKFFMVKKDMGNYDDTSIPKTVIQDIQNKLSQKIPFSVYFKNNNDKFQVITFFPIKNIKKDDTVAYIVKYSTNDYIQELQDDYYLVLGMVLIILAGISFYAYKDYKYKKELAENFTTIHRQKEELTSSVEELERQNIQIAASIEENRKKDTLIAEQSRLASLGEMIGNIAHQWRQPLSAISTSASGIIVQNDLGILDPKELTPHLEKIIEKTHFLSQTIEDFRNFIEGRKEKVEFVISSAVDNALSVVDSSISNHHVIIKKDYQDMIFVTNYKNEFIQGILNIINNAKDALDEKAQKDERFLFITVKKVKNNAIIIFQDNAGGIPIDIIGKVFEPYFTTKHQSQGTGLGLYMTYKIIVDSMQGSLKVENKEFHYKEKTYFGARFEIILPINGADEERYV